MSGTSDNKPCPVCGQDMDVYIDWKPFDIVNMNCVHCGFNGYVKIGMEPDEERRASWESSGLDPADFKPLSESQRREYLETFKVLCGTGELDVQQEALYLGLPVPDNRKVVISVRGGVAYLEKKPEGMEVEIVDYDNLEVKLKAGDI